MNAKASESLDLVGELVSKEFEVPVDDIRSRKHDLKTVLARWALCHLAAWWECIEAKDTAEWIGCKPHAVHHALRTINNDLETNRKFKEKVDRIGAILEAAANKESPEHAMSEWRQEVANDDHAIRE